MSLDDVRLLTPWPDTKPNLSPNLFGWCSEPHDDVFKHFLTDKTNIVLEVGTFLGKSTKLALDCAKNATIICVDPWWDTVFPDQFLPDVPVPTPLPSQWDQFCVNMWDYRHRVIPVKGVSQMKLFDLYHLGVKPDFIYLDGWHTFEQVVMDLELCYRFFPDAKIFGDDWLFKLNNSNVNGGVLYWVKERGFTVQVHKNHIFRIIK